MLKKGLKNKQRYNKIRRRSRRSNQKTSHKRTKYVGNTKVTYWKSTRPGKKWMTITPQGRKVHWGDKSMKDYTQHHSKRRRSNYRKRHAGIKRKDGSRAIDKKWSPAWLSYHITW